MNKRLSLNACLSRQMESIMVAKNVLEPFSSPATDAGIMELTLMLPSRQFDALEQRARGVGMSVAQFLRRLVHESIASEIPARQPK
jgi:hypothetical protein